MYHIEFHERIKNKNAVYYLQISAFVPEIFVFEKYIKFANEITNDIIYSTQYYTKRINRAILVNLHHRPLKLGRLMDYKGNTPMTIKFLFPWQLSFFQSPPNVFICLLDHT